MEEPFSVHNQQSLIPILWTIIYVTSENPRLFFYSEKVGFSYLECHASYSRLCTSDARIIHLRNIYNFKTCKKTHVICFYHNQQREKLYWILTCSALLTLAYYWASALTYFLISPNFFLAYLLHLNPWRLSFLISTAGCHTNFSLHENHFSVFRKKEKKNSIAGKLDIVRHRLWQTCSTLLYFNFLKTPCQATLFLFTIWSAEAPQR